MSDKLEFRRVVDPRTDVNSISRREYNIYDGGENVSYATILPSGGVSNSQMTFICNPNDDKTFWDRRVLVRMTYVLNFTGVSAGPGIPLLQMKGAATSIGVLPGLQNYDAPRCQPIANSLNSVNVKIGNDTISQNPSSYTRALSRYVNDVKQRSLLSSLSPQMLDQSITYAELDGTNRNPLGGYGLNFQECARGGFTGVTILTNTSTGIADTASVSLECAEYLELSPFISRGATQDTAFIGFTTASIVLQLGGRGVGALSGLSAAVWSHSSLGSVLTAVTTNVTAASVLLTYIVPDSTQVIPSVNHYPYSDIGYYPTTNQNPVPALSQAILTQNSITLNSIPSRVYIWVAPQDSSVDISSTDTYFRIDNIRVIFATRISVVEATAEQLYAIALENGCNMEYSQWTKNTGSVLALDFGKDIPLMAKEAVGKHGQFTFYVTVTCTNLSGVAVIPTISVMTLSDGVLTIDNGVVTRSVGILTESEILSSKQMPATARRPMGDSLYGGGFWQDVGNFFKKALRPAIDVAKNLVPQFAPQFAPLVEGVDKFAKSQGYGLVGGKSLSRASMMKRLK